MFDRASSASTAAESSRPRTASHSSGVNRPQRRGAHQEVPGPEVERGQNLVCQIVGDVPSTPGEPPDTLIGVLEVAKP